MGVLSAHRQRARLEPATGAAGGQGQGAAATVAVAAPRPDAFHTLAHGAVDGVADARDDEDGGAEGEGPWSVYMASEIRGSQMEEI